MKSAAMLRAAWFALFISASYGVAIAADSPTNIRCERADGFVMQRGGETLHVFVCSPTLLHVVAGPGDPKSSSPQEPWITASCPATPFEFKSDDKKRCSFHNGPARGFKA